MSAEGKQRLKAAVLIGKAGMCQGGEEYRYLLADSCLRGMICVLFSVEIHKLHYGNISAQW